jgi:sugar/nucleoside kinase (ribokinase family)
VTRYPRADYACIAEHELRLEMRDMITEPPPLMEVVARKLGCGQFVVTRGRKGCMVRAEDGSFIEVPSFAIKTVDRVGAGDAFFSLTAPLALQQVPSEALGFVGNVVGALAVGILGNQKSIDKMSVVKYITSLMK